ncbi:MAG: efflux RND transporter periplasmic adaptor subunit, partial [Bradyrhizobium sp.]|nr:efflux RND transporter periplasmic adaptor subunit [Bradyrhizobium sp.]
MLFKPDEKGKEAAKKRRRGLGRRLVSTAIALLIIGGLGTIGWNALQQRQGQGPGGNRGGG